jgi:hypothetical protein
MPEQNWFPRTSQQIIHALRFGGFASFIPCVIEPVWEGEAPPLAWFPVSICFTGLRLDDHRDPSYVVSCYWFDPHSYKETTEYQSMCYRSRYLKSQHQVVLARSKVKENWEGRKMRSGEVVLTASGTDFTRFVIQLTMLGLDDGEHVEPMLTRVDTASTGIWVYDPAMAELARVGRLQRGSLSSEHYS